MSRRCIPIEDRFWDKVHITDGCWIWTAALSGPGYGVIGTGGRRPNGTAPIALAHRIAYELLVGPIPEGMHIDHLCRNRACVRPEHLEPVTQAENNRRGAGYTGRLNAWTTCPRGHRTRSRRCHACARYHPQEVAS